MERGLPPAVDAGGAPDKGSQRLALWRARLRHEAGRSPHAATSGQFVQKSAGAPEAFNNTDSGNAEYFAARHSDDVQYDHRRGRWLVWQGHRWQPDVDGHVKRLAKAAMRQRFLDAGTLEDPDARARAAKWAIASESKAKLDALLALAQSERTIADSGANWDADRRPSGRSGTSRGRSWRQTWSPTSPATDVYRLWPAWGTWAAFYGAVREELYSERPWRRRHRRQSGCITRTYAAKTSTSCASRLIAAVARPTRAGCSWGFADAT